MIADAGAPFDSDVRDRLTHDARRWLTFACLVIPVIGLALVWGWAGVNMPVWSDSPTELSLPIRLVLYFSNWMMRVLPFFLLGVLLTGPLLVAGIAASTGAFSALPDPGRHRAILRWWAAGASIAVAPTALTYALFQLSPPAVGSFAQRLAIGALAPALLTLSWAGFVCYSISLGDALALQRARVASGASSIRLWWVVVLCVVLYVVGFFLDLLVPLAIWWAARRDPVVLQSPVRGTVRSRDLAIRFDADGFVVTPECGVRGAWSDVGKVLAFKRDVFAYDLLCLGIEMPGPNTLWVTEEIQGWQAFVEALPEFLPGAKPWSVWFDEVALPPFETKPTLVYARGAGAAPGLETS